MRCHNTPTRVAQIKNSEGTKCWWGYERNPHLALRECKMAPAPLENTFIVSYEVKYTLTIWPKGPTLRDLPKRNEDIHPYKNLFANVHSSFINNCPKPGNNPNIHHLVHGQNVIPPYMKNYSVIKWNKLLLSAIHEWISEALPKWKKPYSKSYCIIPFKGIL